MRSEATTPEAYLKSLPEDRKQAMTKVREIILKNLPKGYEETMNWGMISYEIPLSRYPVTYNKQPLGYAALASQKNYMTVYLHAVYANSDTEKWFKKRYEESGKKLDMGKSCVHFKKLEDLPLDLIAETIALVSVDDYIKRYEEVRATTATHRKKSSAKK